VNTVNHYALAPPASLHAESLEGQVALRIAARLNGGSEVLPHDITERLRFGRERALTVAFEQRRVAALAASPSHVGNTGMTALLAGPSAWWLRLASALPLAVLVAGLVLIQHHHDFAQIAAAAEIDSALLADELPPAAYRDPGFSEFLRHTEAP